VKAVAKGPLDGRRILVLRNDRIGDLVLALPLVQALKDAGAFVGVLAAPYTADLLRSDPRVDALLVDGPAALDQVRAGAFDTALALWANWRNALLVRRSGIPERIGPSLRPFSWLFTRRLALRRSRGGTHESDLNFDYGRALGLEGPVPEPRLLLAADAARTARAWLKKNGPTGQGPLVFLHPGSGGSAQPWPAERFAGLGLELRKSHKARLVVSGGPGDAGAVEACAAALGRGCVRCRDLDLAPFAALLGEAALFVAGSTGPLHLAAAQGTPVLGLYPPLRAMSPLRWGPRGSRRAVLSPAGLGFRIPPTPGANFLERISVDEAAAACAFLLQGRGSG
jgi:ADP-heptose:LPS heptosyltransferase